MDAKGEKEIARISDSVLYVFVPFRIVDNGAAFEKMRQFSNGLPSGQVTDAGQIWQELSGGIRKYFFNYLMDKVRRPDKKNDGVDLRKCFYIGLTERGTGERRIGNEVWRQLADKQRAAMGFEVGGTRFTLHPQKKLANLNKYSDADFTIENVRLAYFETGIGLLAFGLKMESEGLLALAEAEFLLKQSAENLNIKDGDGSWQVRISSDRLGSTTFAEVSKRILDGLERRDGGKVFENPAFAFFSERPRSNILGMAVMDGVANAATLAREFFYLRNGYSSGYMCEEVGGKGRILGSENIRWGVSNEVAFCLVQKDLYPSSTSFIQDSFRYRFRSNYLFMVLWILHQKYALYALLTEVSAMNVGARNVRKLRDRLLRLKRRFAEYESAYVFARVTEVPEYQDLYDALNEVFALREMYEDVKEPLNMLDESIKDDEDRRGKTMTCMLGLLALFGIFSAYVDSYEFIGKFFGDDMPMEFGSVRFWQVVCVGCITCGMVFGLGWIARAFFGKRP